MSDSAAQFAQSVRTGVKAIWWLYLLRGIFAVIFGIVALSWPGLVTNVLAYIIGFYLILDGIFLIGGAISQRKDLPGWGWTLAQGALTTLAGIFIVILPAWAAALVGGFLIWTLIIWSVVAGIYGVVASLKSRSINPRWGWSLVSNILTIVLSIVVAAIAIADPSFAIHALVWIAGFWALVLGIGLVIIAFRVRKEVKALGDGLAEAALRSNGTIPPAV
ncbi:HdeD family acid-resistance protein [Lysinibacter cavernae]|uniref:Uncharacterized membrane protein HdeD (DUF308 family) n=1 Tax=Lysinibacter cavernae TaxID=1640652 RepID=A0A7X5QYC0_9MICO|nr:DUF308 domain-containing protein [Lysinibacter cavernae]NIH52243.1 uncharacterized membrane protein HdeD (DUF308 family) [Lysinibacter cavernae]